jgi:valyl-tRNA synthetase
MNDDGTYNANAGPYAVSCAVVLYRTAVGLISDCLQGMKRFHIRNKIVADLKEKGLYVEQKDNEMQIPICS